MVSQCPGNSTEFDPTLIFQRILIPVDFGPGSQQALVTACELRRRFGSEIRLFVVRRTVRDGVLSPGLSDPWMRDDVERSACGELQCLAKDVCRGAPCMKYDALHGGDVVNGIAKAVRRFRATVVLLPSSGRRTVLRSLTERIEHSLHVPVILLQGLESLEHAEQEQMPYPADKPVILTPRGRIMANPRWPEPSSSHH